MGNKGIIAMFTVSGLLTLFAAYVSFLPDIVPAKVEVDILKSKDDVVSYLSVSANWNDWILKPAQVTAPRRTLLSGETSGEGSVLKWFSEEEGDGALEIKKIQDSLIVYEMISDNNAFRERGYLTITSIEGGSKIQWLDSLDVSTNLSARFAAQDSSFVDQMKKYNLEALNRLKKIIE